MLGRSSLDEKISTLRICDDAGESCRLEVHEITDRQIEAQEWSAAEKESARALVAAAVKRRADAGTSDASGGSIWWLPALPALVAIKKMANAVAPEVVEETTNSVRNGINAWWGRRSQGQRHGLAAGGAFSLCFLHLALDESQCLSVTGAVPLPFGSELCDLATHLGQLKQWLSSKGLPLLMLVAAHVTGGGGSNGNGIGRRVKEAGAVVVGTAIEAAQWEVPWLPLLLGAVALAGAWHLLGGRAAAQARPPPPPPPPPVQPQTPSHHPPGVRRQRSPHTPHTGHNYTRNIPLSQQQPPLSPAAPAAAKSSIDRAKLSVPVLQKEIRKVLGADAKLPRTKEALVELHRRHNCGS